MTPRQIAYREYLQSDHWKSLRGAVLKRDHYKCTQCQSKEKLQVHHKRYRGHFTDSQLHDLITLCEKCHKRRHDGSRPTNRNLQLEARENLTRGERLTKELTRLRNIHKLNRFEFEIGKYHLEIMGLWVEENPWGYSGDPNYCEEAG